MEYIHGETASRLPRAVKGPVPPDIAVSIMSGALHGLHAAHEAKDERGEPLGIVHRDVSPQNLIVGRDGVTRVLDFGVAKAAGRFHTTEDGKIKGKLAYMAPEQVRGERVTRQTDVWAASVVLWELLTGRRFARGDHPGHVVEQVLYGKPDPPSKHTPGLPKEIDQIVLLGLERKAEKRFGSAREMALALEQALTPALASKVSGWIESVAGNALESRARQLAGVESSSNSSAMAGLVQELVAAREPGSSSDRAKSRVREEPTQTAATSPTQASATDLPSGTLTGTDASALTRRRSRPATIVVGVLAVFGLAATVWALSRGSGDERATAAAESALPSPSNSESAPAARHEPVASASAPAAPVSAEPRASAPPPAAPSVPRAVATPKPKPKPKLDCNPPFTINAEGRKIYKRQCLD
jgi:serine/threonine-protein kinase